MTTMTVRNRREKISPGGMITLPVSARKCLGMVKGERMRVTVAVKDGCVHLAPAGPEGGFLVSARGQLELRGDARAVLQSGAARHFWLELNDPAATVVLIPYEK